MHICKFNSSHNPKKSNRTPLEMKALENLTNNEHIIIKPADKGGGIAIQNKDIYIKEALRLLFDSPTYQVLHSDLLPFFSKEASQLIEKAVNANIISKTEASFLKKDFFKILYFYHLPKVHKDMENPIVAAMDNATSGFSKYIDQFLQPLAQSLPSYIQDGTHLLDMLAPYAWEPTYWWLSLDVTLLYTSIPHDVGVQAVEHFFIRRPQHEPQTGSVHFGSPFILSKTQLF